MNMPRKEGMIQKLKHGVKGLSQMPVELWHLWVVWVLDVLAQYATEKDYQEFLARLALVLEARFEHGSW